MLRRPAVIALIVLATLAVAGIPWWVHARALDMERECIDHLRLIDSAKEQWRLENRVNPALNATPTWADLFPYISDTAAFQPYRKGADFRLPMHPPNATYTIGPMGESPKCAYSGHTYALYGLSIHVGDASIATSDGEDFAVYERPEHEYEREYPNAREHELRLRPAGSIPGATVEVIDEDGHHYKAATAGDGTAKLPDVATVSHFTGPSVVPPLVHWTPPPFGAERAKMTVIVSKEGFLTKSNYIRDPYQLYLYDYNVLLKPRPHENVTGPSASAAIPSPVARIEPVSPRLSHHYAHSRLRLHFTPAYDQAVVHLMIAEANRMAGELRLAETLPIAETNVLADLATPADFIHDLNLGRLMTQKYIYTFSTGTTVSEVHRNPISLGKGKKRGFSLISRLDTNSAVTFASQVMEAAGVDMKAINRDCTTDVTVPKQGSGDLYFMPDYRVDWNVSPTNLLFDDLPDQSSAAMKRKLWPTAPSWKMRAASLVFFEPTGEIESFFVSDPKYIKKKPLESLDLIKLLTPSNSEASVLYEMKVATNAAARRELYIKLGAPASILKEAGLEPANN